MSSMTKIRINIIELIKFHDHKNPAHACHASAMAGFTGETLAAGLIKHYFDTFGSCSILPDKPVQGTRNGKWLDRWIYLERHSIDSENSLLSDNAIISKDFPNRKNTLYQTEVKNWCSHSLGGKRLDIHATATQVVNYAHERYEEQWNTSLNTFQHDYVRKVLLPMRLPQGIPQCTVEPLVAYWYPILPPRITDPIPFFNMPVTGSDLFSSVSIFSMSLYLRQLLNQGILFIDIEAGLLYSRMQRLQQMYLVIADSEG